MSQEKSNFKSIGGRRKLKDDKNFIKAIMIVDGKIHRRKERAKETKPRDMAEKQIEKQCFDWLWNKRDFLKYGKTEMGSSYNERYLFFGFPDLTIFNLKTKTLWFVEIKRPERKTDKEGGLSFKQVDFREFVYHVGGNIKHLVIYSVEELGKIL